MKKLLLGLVGLVLMGAGCSFIANKPVEGKWRLAFDLPAGWTMVEPYDDSKKPINENVNRDMTEVWIQSAAQKICFSTGGPCPEGALVNGTQVQATMLDPHRSLPQDREELKNGFSRLMICEAGGECTQAGHGNYDYYLETDNGNYKFDYYGDQKTAENVILSGKVVNHFTDRATIEVKSQ